MGWGRWRHRYHIYVCMESGSSDSRYISEGVSISLNSVDTEGGMDRTRLSL